MIQVPLMLRDLALDRSLNVYYAVATDPVGAGAVPANSISDTDPINSDVYDLSRQILPSFLHKADTLACLWHVQADQFDKFCRQSGCSTFRDAAAKVD